MKDPLHLFVNGVCLGMMRPSSRGLLEFQYNATWNELHSRLPISRKFPVQKKAYRGAEVENYLSNLLPDSEAILNRIAALHGLASVKPFDLLGAIGKDCVGALQFLKEDEIDSIHALPAIEKKPIQEREIASLLKNLKNEPLGFNSSEDDFRISLAGAQEKTALLKINGKWFRPHGTTPTTHILKPQMDLSFNGTPIPITAEHEWLCLKICSLFGLKTAKADIEIFQDVKALSVERFDRTWSHDHKTIERIIQEDFCQATGTPPHLKYEQRGGPGILKILEILNEGDNPRGDRYHFFKTQIVFWLLGAIDGHAKNFSLQWTAEGMKLAPLYDVLSAEPFVHLKKLSEHKIELAMAVDGKNRHYKVREIQRRHWEHTAHLAKIPESDADQIFSEVLSIGPKLHSLLKPDLPKKFPAHTLDPILEGIAKRLRFIE